MKPEIASAFYDAITKASHPKIDFRNPEAQYHIGLYKPLLHPLPNAENKALVLGCDTGKVAFSLEKLGYEVLGVDCSNDSIRFAREIGIELGSQCRFDSGDYACLPYEKESFNLVVLPSNNIAECSYEDINLLTQQIRFVLNQQGLFCVDMIDQLESAKNRSNFAVVDDVTSGQRKSVNTIPGVGIFEYVTYFWTVAFACSIIGRYFETSKVTNIAKENYWAVFSKDADHLS